MAIPNMYRDCKQVHGLRHSYPPSQPQPLTQVSDFGIVDAMAHAGILEIREIAGLLYVPRNDM